MSLCLEEHDYIGISQVSSMEDSEKNSKEVNFRKSHKDLNLKATELRLGLPGSESPGRENKHGVEEKNGNSLGIQKGFCLRAKRGFSDTINGGSGKWGLSGNGGCEADLSKSGGFLSHRGINGHVKTVVDGAEGCTPPSFKASTGGKEGGASKSTPEKKPPAAKAQVVGWPPVRSFRKNSMANNPHKADEEADAMTGSSRLYVKVSMDGAPYLRKVDIKTYNSYKDLSSALEKMFSCFTIGQCGSQGVHVQDALSEGGLMDLLHGSEYVLTYEDKDGDWMLVGDVPWEMFRNSCKRLRITKSSDAIGLAPRAMQKCKSHN